MILLYGIELKAIMYIKYGNAEANKYLYIYCKENNFIPLIDLIAEM
jgi:hypothetical protein